MKREIGFACVVLCGCPSSEVTPEDETATVTESSTGAASDEDSDSAPPVTSATSGMTSLGTETGDLESGSTDGGSDSSSSDGVTPTSSTSDDGTTSTTSGSLDDDGGSSSSSSGFDDGEASDGTDGGAQVQISGVVRAGVAPGDDGIGTVYIGVRPTFDCFDGTTQYNDVIAAADLSVIGNEVSFSITADLIELSDDESLQVFLDDDLNAADDNDPDPNDMIISPTEDKEMAGCFELGDVDDDVSDVVVVLDDIY